MFRKKAILSLLILGLGFNILGSPNILANDTTVSIDEARNVAKNHILIAVNNNEMANEFWGDTVKFGEEDTLYDLNDNPSAYSFSIENKYAEPQGYIIVSADKTNVPIIEFAYTGLPVFKVPYEADTEESLTDTEESLDDITTESVYRIRNSNKSNRGNRSNRYDMPNKTYYLDGLTYINEYVDKEDEKVVVDILNNEVKSIDSLAANTRLRARNTNRMSKKINEEWKDLNTQSSTPPTSGGIITEEDIEGFEQDYYRAEYGSLTDDDYIYFDQGLFTNTYPQGNYCAPLAGANFCRHLYTSYELYGEFMPRDYSNVLDGTWNNVFDKMYRYMKTNTVENGTHPEDLEDGIKRYLEECGYDVSTGYDEPIEYDRVYQTIKRQEVPFFMEVWDHYRYKNHTMLGVGFEYYKYRSGDRSLYIEVIDAFQSGALPRRFVHSEVGSSSTAIIWVEFND